MTRDMLKKNHAKQESYAFAKKQISYALEKGFYIEATAIQETIISDRMQSYLSSKDPNLFKKKGQYVSLAKMIEKMERLQQEKVCDLSASTLEKIKSWKYERNCIIHGICKSDPGEPTISPSEFHNKAESASRIGKELVKDIENWHRRQKTKDIKASIT